MRISQPTAVEQKRAIPRALAAPGLVCAFLVLVAFPFQHAIAQTTLSVTLQPGQATTTVQAPRNNTFAVSYSAPLHLCNLPPTAASINAQLSALAGKGELPQALTRIENFGTASADSIAQAFAVLTAVEPRKMAYSGSTQSFSQAQLTGGPITHTFATACLNVDEARALLNEIRRGIRAALGMPAPSN